MSDSNKKDVTVITPSIGNSKLLDAIISVKNQTYSNLKHLIVIDGKEYFKSAASRFSSIVSNNTEMIAIPYNTGKNGFNGQRIYASYPHLVDSEYIFFLDEDNWYEPTHVESLVNLIEDQNLDWAYSFRKIYTENKKYVTDDNCESLGKWPIYFTHNNPVYHIDTSAFAFKRDFIQKTCYRWHSYLWYSSPWGCDAKYLRSVYDTSKWDTTRKYTLSYRLAGNPKSATKDFFIEGNKQQLDYYNGKLPWLKN